VDLLSQALRPLHLQAGRRRLIFFTTETQRSRRRNRIGFFIGNDPLKSPHPPFRKGGRRGDFWAYGGSKEKPWGVACFFGLYLRLNIFIHRSLWPLCLCGEKLRIPFLHPWKVSPREAIRIQQELRKKLRLRPPQAPFKTVAAADVSYSRTDEKLFAAFLMFSYPDLTLVGSAHSPESFFQTGTTPGCNPDRRPGDRPPPIHGHRRPPGAPPQPALHRLRQKPPFRKGSETRTGAGKLCSSDGGGANGGDDRADPRRGETRLCLSRAQDGYGRQRENGPLSLPGLQDS
jgi:hypothetical protein